MPRSLKTNRHVEVLFLPLHYGKKEKKINGWEVSLKKKRGWSIPRWGGKWKKLCAFVSEVASHAPSRKYSSLVVPLVFSGEVATSMFLFNRDAFNLCRGEEKKKRDSKQDGEFPLKTRRMRKPTLLKRI